MIYGYGRCQIAIEQINNTAGTVLDLHHDQAGSTRLLTGSTGKTEATFTYSPYGELTGSTGTATTPLGYDGQYTSSDTGLIYLRTRTYDPKTAQFLTVDPLVSISGAPYNYAGDKWKCQHWNLLPSAMSERSADHLKMLDRPRELREDERAVIAQLLAQSFNGRDEIAAQLQGAKVVAEGVGDTRSVRFAPPRGDAAAAPTVLRIPVEGIADDADGVAITVLLHVVAGWVTELEVYRVDGKQISSGDRLKLHTVAVNE